MSLGSYRERSRFIKKVIFWSLILAGLLGLLLIQTKVPTYAASPTDPCEVLGGCVNGIDAFQNTGDTAETFTAFVLRITQFMVYVAAAVAIFFIVLSGYRMITSNGKEEDYKKGREGLVAAVIGLIVAIISTTIISLVGSIVSNSDISGIIYWLR